MQHARWDKIFVPNRRGLKLAALTYRPDPAPRGWLVICHGFTGSKEGGGKSQRMAEYLARHTGFASMLFDFAGNGESGGEFEDLTFSGQVQDLSDIITWCHTQGMTPVVSMGRSFGGSTVLAQAAGDDRVRAVCTWAAPVHLRELFSEFVISGPDDDQRLLLADADGSLTIKNSFFQDLSGFDLLADSARIAPRPLLVVHGAKDEVVPPQEAEEIMAAAGEPKELFLVPEADHQFSQAPERVWEAVAAWLNRLDLEIAS